MTLAVLRLNQEGSNRYLNKAKTCQRRFNPRLKHDHCFRPLAFAEELWGLLPETTLSGTNVTCGETLAQVLVGALRRLRGGDPSSTSESSLEPPKTKENNTMVREAPQ